MDVVLRRGQRACRTHKVSTVPSNLFLKALPRFLKPPKCQRNHLLYITSPHPLRQFAKMPSASISSNPDNPEPSGKVLNVGYRKQKSKVSPIREGVAKAAHLWCGIATLVVLCKGGKVYYNSLENIHE